MDIRWIGRMDVRWISNLANAFFPQNEKLDHGIRMEIYFSFGFDGDN
jgi:hypothetical protein